MTTFSQSGKAFPEVISADLKMLDYQQIDDLSAAVGLSGLPAATVEALIICSVADVRWLATGDDPTSSLGMPLAAGDSIVIRGTSALEAFKAIGTGATLDIAYWG